MDSPWAYDLEQQYVNRNSISQSFIAAILATSFHMY